MLFFCQTCGQEEITFTEAETVSSPSTDAGIEIMEEQSFCYLDHGYNLCDVWILYSLCTLGKHSYHTQTSRPIQDSVPCVGTGTLGLVEIPERTDVSFPIRH